MSSLHDNRARGTSGEASRHEEQRRFYLEQHERLLTFVKRRLDHQGRKDAEDVCQEIWLRFFANYDAHTEKYDNLAMVLFPIARCRVADYWRKRGRSHEMPFEDANLGLLAETLACTDKESVFDTTVRCIDVERALACLTGRQRETLHLRYLDKLAVSEIALLMGISTNTVKSLGTTARDKLRKSAQLDGYRATGQPEEVDE